MLTTSLYQIEEVLLEEPEDLPGYKTRVLSTAQVTHVLVEVYSLLTEECAIHVSQHIHVADKSLYV